jgi:hypothetical protein
LRKSSNLQTIVALVKSGGNVSLVDHGAFIRIDAGRIAVNVIHCPIDYRFSQC